MSDNSRVLEVADMSAAEWFELSESFGWGDGLPTLVPTVAAVDEFLAAAGPFGALPGAIPPRSVVPATRSLAANALMSGCKPSSLPIVVAALRAVLAEEFNAVGIMATTHPCTPLVLVNGEARLVGEVNSSGNCLGQGWRGNATIGRALHLMLVNLGGSTPGTLDRATHGSPAKYTYCFAENEEESPWPPLSVRRGFEPAQSVVTVFAAEGPHNVNDHGSSSGDDVLMTIAGTMASAGSNNFYLDGEHLVVLGPEHAMMLARDGWEPAGIQQRLFDLATVPEVMVSNGKRIDIAGRIAEPIAGAYRLRGGPESIQIVVAGGRGKHSAWIPTFGASRCVSEVVQWGEAWSST